VAEVANGSLDTTGSQDSGSVANTAAGNAAIPLEPASPASLLSDHGTYLVQGDAPSSWLTFRHDGPATWEVSFLDQSGRTFGTVTIAPNSEPMTVDVVDGISGGAPFLLTVDRVGGASEGDRLTVITDEVAPAAVGRSALPSAIGAGLISMLPDEFYEQLLSSEWAHSPAPPTHATSVALDLSVQGESTGSATDLSLPSMPDRIGGWSPIAPAEVLAAEHGGEEAEPGEAGAREVLADLGNGDALANTLATVDLARDRRARRDRRTRRNRRGIARGRRAVRSDRHRRHLRPGRAGVPPS
jgi:hypothetical protein